MWFNPNVSIHSLGKATVMSLWIWRITKLQSLHHSNVPCPKMHSTWNQLVLSHNLVCTLRKHIERKSFPFFLFALEWNNWVGFYFICFPAICRLKLGTYCSYVFACSDVKPQVLFILGITTLIGFLSSAQSWDIIYNSQPWVDVCSLVMLLIVVCRLHLSFFTLIILTIFSIVLYLIAMITSTVPNIGSRFGTTRPSAISKPSTFITTPLTKPCAIS